MVDVTLYACVNRSGHSGPGWRQPLGTVWEAWELRPIPVAQGGNTRSSTPLDWKKVRQQRYRQVLPGTARPASLGPAPPIISSAERVQSECRRPEDPNRHGLLQPVWSCLPDRVFVTLKLLPTGTKVG